MYLFPASNFFLCDFFISNFIFATYHSFLESTFQAFILSSCFCLSIYWCLEYFLQYPVLVDYSFNISCQFLHPFLYFIWIFFFFHRFVLAFCIWYLEFYLVFFQKKKQLFYFLFFLPLVRLFHCHLLLGATHISVFPTLSVKLTLMGGGSVPVTLKLYNQLSIF